MSKQSVNKHESGAGADSGASVAVSCPVLTASGSAAGQIELKGSVFAAARREGLVHEAVCWRRNNARAGTHACITKGAMKGGGKKPWRQKGTGRARAGSSTSPLWVGGGVAHGPKPHAYEGRMAKRMRAEALASALSNKLVHGRLVVVEDLAVPTAKTKEAAAFFQSLKIPQGNTLLLMESDSSGAASSKELGVSRAMRNLPKVVVLPVEGVSAYDVLWAETVVAAKSAVHALERHIEERLS